MPDVELIPPPVRREPESVERVGRLLFGRPARLRLGVWIASLEAHGQRTFCQHEYQDWLLEHDLPLVPMGTDLRRFVELHMLQARTDIYDPAPPKRNGKYDTRPRRARWWTRLESPLWDLFLIAGVILAEQDGFTDQLRRRTLDELIALRDLLHVEIS